MVLLKDVAMLANVSASTVSRVLNAPEKVDKATYERVQSAMKKLNYRPNYMASALRSKSSKQIALIVPNAAHFTSANIIQQACTVLYERGYTLLLGNHNNQYETQAELLSSFFSRNVDGIILYLVYNEASAVQMLLEAKERNIPMVVMGRRISVSSLSNVTVDNYKAGIIAGEYFRSLGHRRLATITGPMVTQWARDRLAGFKSALLSNEMSLCSIYSQDELADFEAGRDAARRMLADFTPDNRPTAVWAQNDIMAVGFMNELSKNGVSTPESVSVLGMDDIELATMVTPMLSTIRQPFSTLVREAIDIITSFSKDDAQRFVSVEPTLIVRDSTAPRSAPETQP